MKLSRRTLLMIVGALAVAAGLAWMLRPTPVPVETVAVTHGPLEVWVEEEGRTRVREIYVVSAPLAGRMVRTVLEEGDAVKAGQTVALIRPADPPLLDARSRRELEAAAQAAQAAVNLSEAELKRAQAELAYAETQWKRGQALAASGAIAAQALDQRRMARDSAAAAVATARAGVAVRRRELDSARARLAGPEALRSAALVAVRAPVGGRVLKVLHESEQVVQAGEPLVQVGDPADLDVMVELLSTDAVQVRPGAAARIEGWGGATLAARVKRIEPAGFTKVSALGVEEQRVRTYLDFDQPRAAWSRLGHDFRVTVRIVTWSAPDVVQVPASALFRQGEAWAVYRVRDGRAVLTPVRVGGRNEDAAQILGGIAVGERVVAYPGDRLVDGVRVRDR